MKTTSFDIYTVVTQQIISLLERGTVPWRKQWKDAGVPINAITKKPYRGINMLYLSCLPYSNPRFMTWKQINDKGGIVKHKEKGHMVVYWQVKNQENPQEQEDTTKTRLLLRYYRVFNIEQTAGLPDSLTVVPTDQLDRTETALPACEAIVSNMPNPPDIVHESAAAYYAPIFDFVNMPKRNTFESDASYYSVLFHELGHSTGHEKRLNRDLTTVGAMRSNSYSFEELVAELTASFLCAHAGIIAEQIENSAAYIKGWLSRLKGDKKFIMQASAKAQQAADYIIGANHLVNINPPM